MQIKLTYMSGAGNLFTVINNNNYQFTKEIAEKIAPILCNINEINHFKTEGLILVEDSKDEYTDFNVMFFNPDGSSGMMCGNGGRVAIRFASLKKITHSSMFFETFFSMANKTYKGILQKETIVLFLQPPKSIKRNINLYLNDLCLNCDYVDIATDHLVIDFNQISSKFNSTFKEFDLFNFARDVRYHNDFKPRGVNVNVYECLGENTLNLRTYERGVELETGACGTGAISTAIIAVMKNQVTFPVKIVPTSGLALIVDIVGKLPDKIDSITLEGNAEVLNEVDVEFPENLL